MYHKSEEEKKELLTMFSDIYDSNMWSLGYYTKCAETLARNIILGKDCLLVNDGTHALELCLRDIGVEGKVVFIPALTVPMLVWAVARAGGIPVYVDVDEFLQMDLSSLKLAFDSESNYSAAVILVHTGGLISPDILKFRNFCKLRGLKLIEDCSHSQKSYLDIGDVRVYAGATGDYATFSMYATKVVSAGEGGIAAKNGDISYMKVLRNQGKEEGTGDFLVEGYNYRASEWTAAVACVKIKNVDQEIAYRTSLANMYINSGITPMNLEYFDDMKMVPSYYKFIIRKDKKLEKFMRFTSGAVHRPALCNVPMAAKMANGHVCLPLNSEEVVLKTIEDVTKYNLKHMR